MLEVKKFFNGLETEDYLDGFQYKFTNEWEDESGSMMNDEMRLRIIPTSEGYFDALRNRYFYNYTDHLGNVRLTYSDADGNGTVAGDVLVEECFGGNCSSYIIPGEIDAINNYYPFGMLHNYTATTQSAYQYKYNGKELQETGMYDYGARFYMPDIGRWGVVDPLAEKDKRWTPYRYAYNNPLRFIDPDGRNEELVITGQDADVAVKELNDDSALKLSRNSQTGKVNIDNKSNINYKKLSAVDQKLYDVIESTNKTVNLSTTRALTTQNSSGGIEAFVIGKFNGQTSTTANPDINVIQSQGLENSGGQTAGTSIRHEIFESFIAVELAQSFDLLRSVGIVGPNSSNMNFYKPAHDAAKSIDPNFNFEAQSNQLYMQQTSGQPSVLWYNPNKNANINSTGWIKLQ